MTVLQMRDCLKEIIQYEDEWFGIARMDANRPKAFCLYQRAKSMANNIAIGGLDATGYACLPLTLLIRWTDDANEAEQKAKQVHESLIFHKFETDERTGFLQGIYSSAIPLGADDRGIFEYCIEVDAYYCL